MNYLLTIVFVSLVALFLFRYEFNVLERKYAQNVNLGVYRHDRWTGKTEFCLRGRHHEDGTLVVRCVPVGD